MKIVPIILSGGSGTRLWPVSRETHPKQLAPLIRGHSLLQQTALRLAAMEGSRLQFTSPVVVCNVEHRFMVAEQLSVIGITDARIILEPCGRNTAPALTLAVEMILQDTPDALMLVMPADHVISDLQSFRAAIEQAKTMAARQDAIVTFGIVPQRAETGYGYIDAEALPGKKAFRMKAFMEKPDRKRAKAYMESGHHFWNSGLFMLRAQIWRHALQQLEPDMYALARQAVVQAAVDVDFIRVDTALFGDCPSDSIDYAVMERLAETHGPAVEGMLVPLQAGWNDVGTWDAIQDVMDKDACGNALHGDARAQACTNSLLHSNTRLVVGIGLKNTVVVETSDAVLVLDKAHAQNVKQVVEALKQEGRTSASTHRKIHRPWGWYDSIDAGERFQVKRIVVDPGARLSLQMHHHRAEHWVVVRGTARVTRGTEVLMVSENESTFIPLGQAHRLENPGKVPLEIIEVQSGAYLGEDDIVRLEDVYGRDTPVSVA
ncbi:MAG: mannose-1-phosphate guanylyltransferase/mannose-6-phosphate isomerase [Pseudomonadota bacterium]|nr:mannose-1-phosphate guanylyltransferase/mannose-6-phosphate isomerase [Pseudomonadota bacterium]